MEGWISVDEFIKFPVIKAGKYNNAKWWRELMEQINNRSSGMPIRD